MYQNGSNHLLYAGFTQESRRYSQNRTGTLMRVVEHSERIYRTHRPGTKAHRSAAFKRGVAGTHGNIIVRRKKTPVAQVMETQVTNGMNFGGDTKKVKRGRGRHGRPSRRPPPWRLSSSRKTPASCLSPPVNPPPGDLMSEEFLRQEEKKGPLDTPTVRKARKEKVRKLKEEQRKRKKEKEKDPVGFADEVRKPWWS